VGGVERVFEMARCYRNEGISTRHNPEFTMLEAYQAYGDYRTMMDLTEACIVEAIRATGQPTKLQWGDKTVDFTPPFARKTYDEVIAEHVKISPTDQSAVANAAKKLGLETTGKHPDVIKSELFEAAVEKQLVGPVFVTDYPASICPLTKRKADNPAVAERFELIVHGMEIANAYTELNDPKEQCRRFEMQLELKAAGDEEAHQMDEDYLRAMSYGMPPTGGEGIGIDRLTMILTNSKSIRDVILFPLLRPEGEIGIAQKLRGNDV